MSRFNFRVRFESRNRERGGGGGFGGKKKKKKEERRKEEGRGTRACGRRGARSKRSKTRAEVGKGKPVVEAGEPETAECSSPARPKKSSSQQPERKSEEDI